jgi:hypothetical protein
VVYVLHFDLFAVDKYRVHPHFGEPHIHTKRRKTKREDKKAANLYVLAGTMRIAFLQYSFHNINIELIYYFRTVTQ